MKEREKKKMGQGSDEIKSKEKTMREEGKKTILQKGLGQEIDGWMNAKSKPSEEGKRKKKEKKD